MSGKKIYNDEFIDLMDKLTNIMSKKGEHFRAKAYQKAQEIIMMYPNDITNTEQLKGLNGIGPTIMDKLNEFVETGTLRIIESEKTNPINILSDVYGIGPKKAQELVDIGVTSIEMLRQRQDELLNNQQKVGLKYYDDIQKRIPRSEIQEYERIFKSVFDMSNTDDDAKFDIVGSYRRGALNSGDIDVIITGSTGDVYKKFVDNLIKRGIIIVVLSRGLSKTLVITKLPGVNSIARRVDFLYSPPDEFPFAILYFTGSKTFNTVMRQHGLNQGYTFNEHGMHKLVNGNKEKVETIFRDEKDIFEFLGLEYKRPEDRKNGSAVVAGDNSRKNGGKMAEKCGDRIPGKMAENIGDTIELSLINMFKSNGISVLDKLNENQLTNIIRYANDKYFNDTPVMTDNQYDIIKEYVENKYPNNPTLFEIGAKVDSDDVVLPFFLPSMNKIKPDTNALENWMKKYKGPYVVSCKLDGISGAFVNNVNGETLLSTRGDGKVGKKKTHLIPYLRLPKTENIAIRGEFIMKKKVFEQKYKHKFSNIRNAVGGIINRKTISEEIKDISFVAYEVLYPEMKPSDQMKLLETLDVETVLYSVDKKTGNNILSSKLLHHRDNYEYIIDGEIVKDDNIYETTDKNPEHAFAFKMVLTSQIAEAKVVDVIWTPSKDGYLKPRVQIETIYLDGVNITYATGFNAAFIENNKIGIGAIIELIRSGDVIPHIRSVTVPADEAKMPSVPYEWNETHVDIMLKDAENDPTVIEKNVTMFFKGIGVDGLSSGYVSKIINAGYDNVASILEMTEKDFYNVFGEKSKTAPKLYNGIQSKIESASLITIMASSNIFGRGFSEKRLELIMNELPDILISNETDYVKINNVSNIKGMANKTAEAFVSKIDDFKYFLEECGLEDKLYETNNKKQPVQSTELTGKTIVLTGTRDKNILEYLKNVGAIQGSSVNKNTYMLIAKSTDDDTGKAEDARKLRIPIMSVSEFVQKYT